MVLLEEKLTLHMNIWSLFYSSMDGRGVVGGEADPAYEHLVFI